MSSKAEVPNSYINRKAKIDNSKRVTKRRPFSFFLHANGSGTHKGHEVGRIAEKSYTKVHSKIDRQDEASTDRKLISVTLEEETKA